MYLGRGLSIFRHAAAYKESVVAYVITESISAQIEYEIDLILLPVICRTTH